MMEELNERIKDKVPSLAYRAIQPSFTWETAVGYLQHCADIAAGEPIGMLNYKLPMADQIDSIKPVKDYLTENLDVEVIGCELGITFTTLSVDKYFSDNDLILWNVLGYSDFKIAEEDRTVEPGDLVYIPKNTDFYFNPKSSRSYVIFSLKGEDSGNKDL